MNSTFILKSLSYEHALMAGAAAQEKPSVSDITRKQYRLTETRKA